MTTVSSHPVSYDAGYNLRSDSANLENAFTDSDSDTYAALYIVNGSNSESYIYYNFNLNIPLDAVIDSVACTVKGKMSNTGGTTARELQLFSGSTAKGTATSITSTSLQTLTLNAGTWTAAELNNAKLRFYAKRGTSATTTNRHYDLYGATLTVAYTVPSTGDKIYIKVNGTWQEAADIKVKVNGTWQSVSKAYKKVNGSWVEQSDKSAMFDTNALYLKG